MADHFQNIYNHQADQYERLVSREDYQQKILPALNQICPLAGLDVVEMGAGTGRLSCLLAPLVGRLHLFDVAQPLLKIAATRLTKMGLHNWQAGLADNRRLPVADQVADVVLEGWSFGHFTGWYPDYWRSESDRALAEMRRVLRSGGTAIILETLGTGFETPTPPNQDLADFYAYLEQDHGFSHTWIRTDYQFSSLAEAEELTGFFFGQALAQQVIERDWVILPECTGIWWLKKDTTS